MRPKTLSKITRDKNLASQCRLPWLIKGRGLRETSPSKTWRKSRPNSSNRFSLSARCPRSLGPPLPLGWNRSRRGKNSIHSEEAVGETPLSRMTVSTKSQARHLKAKSERLLKKMIPGGQASSHTLRAPLKNDTKQLQTSHRNYRCG